MGRSAVLARWRAGALPGCLLYRLRAHHGVGSTACGDFSACLATSACCCSAARRFRDGVGVAQHRVALRHDLFGSQRVVG